MPLIKQYSRISHHTVTVTGFTGSTMFTVPPTEDLSSGAWSVYDLALSEIGVAEALNKAYIRIGNNINELSFGGASSTFTGNTSASCISDLYVSNIYGCSPITVRDQMVHKDYAFYTPMSAYTSYGDTLPYLTGASGNALVTKEYVDSLAVNTGEAGVIAVKCVQSAILTNTVYDNGTNGVGAILSASTNYSISSGYFDDQVFNGDRVLIWLQPNQIHNGVYQIVSVGAASGKFILERTTDSDETAELDPQIVIPTRGGSAGKRFGQITQDPIIGTDNIVYKDVGSLFVTQINSGPVQATGQVAYWTSTGRMLFRGSPNFYYNQSLNRLGLGTNNPATTLDVIGKTKTNQLQVVSGATVGYVLTCVDLSGNTEWQAYGGTDANCVTDFYVQNINQCTSAGLINITENISAGAAGQDVSNTSFAFGSLNTLSGINDIALGRANTVTNDYAIAIGNSNDVITAADYGFAQGFQNNVSAKYGFASGEKVSVQSYGEIARSSNGTDCQYGTVTFHGTVTTSGLTSLYLDAGNTIDEFTINDGWTYKFNVFGVAHSANDDIAAYESEMVGYVNLGNITYLGGGSDGSTFGPLANRSDSYLSQSKIQVADNGSGGITAKFQLFTGYTNDINVMVKLDYMRVI